MASQLFDEKHEAGRSHRREAFMAIVVCHDCAAKLRPSRAMIRFALFAITLFAANAASAQESTEAATDLSVILEEAADLTPLETVLVAHDGVVIAEQGYRGNGIATPTNIKSASKTIISALVGIAIDKGILDGVDQPIATLLGEDMPDNADERLQDVTIGHLLSMQAGQEPTSGGNYGRWVVSGNWVRFALAQPFVDEPGGRMLYSTGSTHLLSAILTRASGRSTLELAREWLGPIAGFVVGGWERDPQGVYMGGNQMAISPRALLGFGEVYRNDGRTPEGEQIVSPEWIDASWEPRTNSRFNRDGYGYGWFLRTINGHQVRYAWGYGGQMLYVVPALDLTVVMTSDDSSPAARTGHRDDLHDLLGKIIDVVDADRAPTLSSSPVPAE
jgi:CubicO group peptidase (beta-lactamase class C family)